MTTAMFLALLLMQGAEAQGTRVQRGMTVRPDTVTVGDPFVVAIRIRAPRGATIEFPETPDSGAVEAIDPVQITAAAETSYVEQTAIYRVAAWDVGRLPVRLANAVVTIGQMRLTVELEGAEVFVRSVLPADSALRVPKPARDVFTFGLPWWIWALLALAVLAVFLLIWWLWRRRRRRPPAAVDPYVVAERGFARVEALGLVAAGERSHHASLMVEVLRDYLAAVLPRATNSLTTIELLPVLKGSRGVPLQRVGALLTEVDLIKFARRPVSADRATHLGVEARAVAAAVHGALTASQTSLERAA